MSAAFAFIFALVGALLPTASAHHFMRCALDELRRETSAHAGEFAARPTPDEYFGTVFSFENWLVFRDQALPKLRRHRHVLFPVESGHEEDQVIRRAMAAWETGEANPQGERHPAVYVFSENLEAPNPENFRRAIATQIHAALRLPTPLVFDDNTDAGLMRWVRANAVDPHTLFVFRDSTQILAHGSPEMRAPLHYIAQHFNYPVIWREFVTAPRSVAEIVAYGRATRNFAEGDESAGFQRRFPRFDFLERTAETDPDALVSSLPADRRAVAELSALLGAKRFEFSYSPETLDHYRVYLEAFFSRYPHAPSPQAIAALHWVTRGYLDNTQRLLTELFWEATDDEGRRRFEGDLTAEQVYQAARRTTLRDAENAVAEDGWQYAPALRVGPEVR